MVLMGGGRGGRRANPKGGRSTKCSLASKGRHITKGDRLDGNTTVDHGAAALRLSKSGNRGELKLCKGSKNLIRVTVHSMNGEVLELDMWPESRISNIKDAISDQWRWPTLCQKLALQDLILDEDSVRIAVQCIDGAQCLSLSLVVSQDAILEELQQNDSIRAKLALNQCVTLGTKAMVTVTEAIRARLRDRSGAIRRIATKALVHTKERGDYSTIVDVCTGLGDRDDNVRNMAVHALGIIGKGSPEAIAVISRVIEDPTSVSSHVPDGSRYSVADVANHDVLGLIDAKLAAIRALVKIADKNDSVAARTLSRCLCSHTDKVRTAAVKALGQIVETGNKNAIKELADVAKIDRRAIEAVLKVIRSIAEKGDRLAIDEVVIPLLSMDSLFRYSRKRRTRIHAAAESLVEITEKGDRCVIDRLLDVIAESARAGESCSAHADALTQITDKGDQQVICAVCKILEDPEIMSSFVKITLVHVLEQLAEKDDDQAIRSLVNLSRDVNMREYQKSIATLRARLQNHYASNRISKAARSELWNDSQEYD